MCRWSMGRWAEQRGGPSPNPSCDCGHWGQARDGQDGGAMASEDEVGKSRPAGQHPPPPPKGTTIVFSVI